MARPRPLAVLMMAATGQAATDAEVARASGQRLKASLGKLFAALTRGAAGVLLAKVDAVADKLEHVAATGGVGLAAALGGGRALLSGRNLVWGVVKGALAALPVPVVVLLVVAVILILLLGPVLLVVLLLVALVVAVILGIRAATRAQPADG